jgi:uncharacterized protein YxjI
MEIHISRNGQSFGPYTLSEVQAGLKSGNILETDLAWYDSAPGWLPISNVEGLNLIDSQTSSLHPLRPSGIRHDPQKFDYAHEGFGGSLAAQPHYAQLHPSFQQQRFLIRRKLLTFVGAKLHVFNEVGEIILYSKMKAFKLKDDITIFTNESMNEPLVRIRSRNIIDFAGTYDVFDVSTGQEYHIGALRRKGVKSLIKDEWLIFNTQDQQIGQIVEENASLALLRRFVGIMSFFLPKQFDFTIGNYPVGLMKQTFNPFVMKMTADFSQDTQGYLDRRLAASAAVMLCIIERKQ